VVGIDAGDDMGRDVDAWRQAHLQRHAVRRDSDGRRLQVLVETVTTTACVGDGEGICATIDDDAAESAPTAAATADAETSVSVSLFIRAASLFAIALPQSLVGSRYMVCTWFAGSSFWGAYSITTAGLAHGSTR
jgi:hypothetical protein